MTISIPLNKLSAEQQKEFLAERIYEEICKHDEEGASYQGKLTREELFDFHTAIITTQNDRKTLALQDKAGKYAAQLLERDRGTSQAEATPKSQSFGDSDYPVDELLDAHSVGRQQETKRLQTELEAKHIGSSPEEPETKEEPEEIVLDVTPDEFEKATLSRKHTIEELNNMQDRVDWGKS